MHTVFKHLVSRVNAFKVSERHFSHVLTFFLLIHRGSPSLQFTIKLNPSPLIDPPKVTFQSHDLHFVILLEAVNTAMQVQLFCIRGFTSQDKCSESRLETSNHHLKRTNTQERKIDFLKISHCPDPFLSVAREGARARPEVGYCYVMLLSSIRAHIRPDLCRLGSAASVKVIREKERERSPGEMRPTLFPLC